MKYQIDPRTGCWNWQGGIGTHGYGYLSKHRLAHRHSYEIHYGKIPKGMNVCHHCDNRKCVNPKHLFLGTQVDNMLDASAKGRLNPRSLQNIGRGRVPGYKSEKRKLTAGQVKLIRLREAAGETQSALARAFGVSQATIWRVIRKRTYKN